MQETVLFQRIIKEPQNLVLLTPKSLTQVIIPSSKAVLDRLVDCPTQDKILEYIFLLRSYCFKIACTRTKFEEELNKLFNIAFTNMRLITAVSLYEESM